MVPNAWATEFFLAESSKDLALSCGRRKIQKYKRHGRTRTKIGGFEGPVSVKKGTIPRHACRCAMRPPPHGVKVEHEDTGATLAWMVPFFTRLLATRSVLLNIDNMGMGCPLHSGIALRMVPFFAETGMEMVLYFTRGSTSLAGLKILKLRRQS